jgi:hypothetical protein
MQAGAVLQSIPVCSIMARMTRTDEARRREAGLADDSRDALIERVAVQLETAGVSAPAIAFLEANRPLAFVGSQMLLVAQPFLSPFAASLDGWVEVLEDRGSVERLIRRLEMGPRVGLHSK